MSRTPLGMKTTTGERTTADWVEKGREDRGDRMRRGDESAKESVVVTDQGKGGQDRV